LHLDLSSPILYNPIRINKPAFLSFSINPSLYPFQVARRLDGLEVWIDPISEEELGFFVF